MTADVRQAHELAGTAVGPRGGSEMVERRAHPLIAPDRIDWSRRNVTPDGRSEVGTNDNGWVPDTVIGAAEVVGGRT